MISPRIENIGGAGGVRSTYEMGGDITEVYIYYYSNIGRSLVSGSPAAFGVVFFFSFTITSVIRVTSVTIIPIFIIITGVPPPITASSTASTRASASI